MDHLIERRQQRAIARPHAEDYYEINCDKRIPKVYRHDPNKNQTGQFIIVEQIRNFQLTI